MTKRVTFDLPAVAYHARSLSKQGIIRCVRTERVKGGVVHFYVSNVKGNELVAQILSETEVDDAHTVKAPTRIPRSRRAASKHASPRAGIREPVSVLTGVRATRLG